MKKITYFFNKAGRKLGGGKEKLVVYTQEDDITLEYPDSVLERTEIKDLVEPISFVKPGDVVLLKDKTYPDNFRYDVVSSINITKGKIKLTWNNALSFSLEDGHGLSSHFYITPETDKTKIEEIKKALREDKLRDEIAELEDAIYNLSEEDLIKILELLKKIKPQFTPTFIIISWATLSSFTT